MLEFNKIEEIKKYFNEDNNTYEFIKNGSKQDVVFNFSLDIDAKNIDAGDINAWDINAHNINAWNIHAVDINAHNINAGDINASDINAVNIHYYAICLAYNNFTCKKIEGTRKNSKHFCLDNEIIFKKGEK